MHRRVVDEHRVAEQLRAVVDEMRFFSSRLRSSQAGCRRFGVANLVVIALTSGALEIDDARHDPTARTR
jgi:hypothetical protein